MKKKLFETTKEALSSVLPITAVVFLLSITVTPMPAGTMLLFMFGAVMLVIGMGLFTMGADMSLISLGEDIGIKMTTGKKAVIVALISFAMGLIITVAEPDLQVLSKLVTGIPGTTLILTVSCGVGIFLMLAIFRILLRIPLSRLLIICYSLVIVLSFFAPRDYVAVAFDSGGVTTGPITVPFILAMGFGIASIRSDKNSMEDSFGLVALCSIGPILAVMLLGIVFRPQGGSNYVAPIAPDVANTKEMILEFVHHTPLHMLEVLQSVWPLVAVVFVFQALTRRYRVRQLVRMLIGFIYTMVGLVIFLTGVSVGFIPVGQYVGLYMAESTFSWFLVPLGAIVGYFIVAAEPAVHVLKKQIEEISGGGIPGHAVQRYLSIGTAAALSISMLRVLTGVSIYWFLIPGYIAAIVLTFFVPKIFVGIAFDSGGVVSGPMTSTFLLPFAIGACTNPDRIMMDAFGLVAMVAMAPLIALQLMGFVYKNKMQQATNIDLAVAHADDIIEYEEVLTDDE